MEYVLSIIGLPQNSLRLLLAPLVSFGRHVTDHFIPHARNNYHPHVLGHRNLALMSGLLVAVKIFALGLVAFGPATAAFSSAITSANIINLTNESRQQFGQTALTENPALDQAAQAKANDMLAKGYFAHNTPDGKTPWDFIVAAGYSYLMAGENLAVNFTEAENVETAWMNSPGHRANILNNNFEEIGIGIAQGEYQNHTAIFVVQEFGTPAAQKVAINNTPTPVQQATVPAPKAPALTAASPAPQIQGESKATPAPLHPKLQPASTPQPASGLAPAVPQAVTVESGNVSLSGSNAIITAKITGSAVKVLAYFGGQAIMLSPKTEGAWEGTASLASLTQTNVTVRLEAFDMKGQSGQLQLADFAPSTQDNYNLAGSTPSSFVTFLGHKFDPNGFTNQFYLMFIAGLLASLILAISVKRHIQHLSLIANSSFVIIFATLLWWVR